VVVVGVRDHEVIEALLGVRALGEHVTEDLEHVDRAVSRGAEHVDEHVLATRECDQRAVALADVEEDGLEVRHVIGASGGSWGSRRGSRSIRSA